MTSSIGAARRAQARYRARRNEDGESDHPAHNPDNLNVIRARERERVRLREFWRRHHHDFALIIRSGGAGYERTRKAREVQSARRENRHRLREIAGLPKRRKAVKLQAARGPPGVLVYHVVVPAYIVRETGLSKGDLLRIHVDRGKRIIFEPKRD